MYRQTLFLHITLTNSRFTTSSSSDNGGGRSTGSSSDLFQGIGEAAPLPGLHQETFEQASQQLHLLAELLQGLPVPKTLALLSTGSFDLWLKATMGVNPAALYPSVRCAVETALLQALAAAQGCSMAELLLPLQQQQQADAGSRVVSVNALLPGTGTAEDLVAAGLQLAAEGASVIKVKVGRRYDTYDICDTCQPLLFRESHVINCVGHCDVLQVLRLVDVYTVEMTWHLLWVE
jgi:L-alanine-DL-glutamate epimerase-like enolase superfamily enzyme